MFALNTNIITKCLLFCPHYKYTICYVLNIITNIIFFVKILG